MRHHRWIASVTVLLVTVGMTMVAATTATAGTTAETPKATDVGITASEIHVAVIADVDNPIVPNLYKGVVDAVKGAANYLNSKAGGGGLAGRKVVVDFYDSKLNANQTTNAIIQACHNDLAAVGTSAAFLTSVQEMRTCPDATGAVTGLPDLPFAPASLTEQCSDQSYPMSPPTVVCSTRAQHPQTFQPNVGRGYYYEKKFGKDLHGAYIFLSSSKAARDAIYTSGIGQVRVVCCKSDTDVDMPGAATQSQYTPVVQTMKDKGSNYGQGSGANQQIALRKEAVLQGLTGVKVWDCTTGCYTKNFLANGGADVEGNYVDTLYLPFFSKAERKTNPMLADFVKYTGADKVDGFGVYAWASMIAFRDAVNAAVKAHGVNGITRKTIFEALDGIHQFSADGMMGTIDLAGRKTTPCHVLLQVHHGDFERVYPTKPGTFDCAKKNVREVQLDAY